MVGERGDGGRVGDLIRRARVSQRRTQRDVAAALGYHQSKLSRLESGRGTEDVHVLRAVSRELRIPAHHVGLAEEDAGSSADRPAPGRRKHPGSTRTDDAHERQTHPRGPGTDTMHRRAFLAVGIAALAGPRAETAARTALVRMLLPGHVIDPRSPVGVDPSRAAAVASFPSLRDRVGTARRLLYACDYEQLERTLPSLIADLRHTADPAGVHAGLLATAYQTATSLLLKQHDQGNAWLAVGRAMNEAERSGDPVVLASSVRVQAHVLAREQHTTQAVTLVRHTAGHLSGSYDRRPPEYLAAVGLLLLRGVTAAGAGQDRAAVAEFLAEAKEVARYATRDESDAWANFSTTNVALHEVSAWVDLGEAGLALRTARPLMSRAIAAPERRAALWVDTARAHNLLGRLPEACRALRTAESCAPQEVHRPPVRDLVADMAARDPRRTLPELHRFAHRLGVPA